MQQTNQPKNYNIAADYLRALAILAVVLIHTTTKTLEVGQYDVLHLSWSLFLNQIFRFAVPLFFLISGFLLELNYKDNLNYLTYFKKRISKIFIPFVVWSVFYYAIIFKFPLFNWNFLSNLLTGDASYQLYFIPTLLIFYLLFPFLHSLRIILFNKFVILFLLSIELVLLAIDYYVKPFSFVNPIRIALLNFSPFLIGMLASHHEQRILHVVKRFFVPLIFILLFALFGVFYESKTYYLTQHNLNAIYSQYRPLMYLYTLILTSILFFVFSRRAYLKNIFLAISRLSFFVFFVHVAILYLYWYTIGIFLVTATKGHILRELWYDPFVFLFVSSLSLLLALIFSKKLKLTWLLG